MVAHYQKSFASRIIGLFLPLLCVDSMNILSFIVLLLPLMIVNTTGGSHKTLGQIDDSTTVPVSLSKN